MTRAFKSADFLEPERPVFDLSGPKLRASLENLVRAAELAGGIESYAAAVRIKSEVFRDRLAEGRVATIEIGEFEPLVVLMATVRRRFQKLVQAQGWSRVRSAMTELLDNAHVPGTGDERLARLCTTFPDSRETRFLRDLGAELLHNVYPEQYPLMTRWVWDAKTNTGVVREIWHDKDAGDDVDHVVIPVPDTHEAFLVLREELSQFIADNGVFRDVLWYVDLLKAQIYGDYINAQGGAYLKTDFTAGPDLLEQSRRILGLDRIDGRPFTKRNAIDGSGHDVDAIKRLN